MNKAVDRFRIHMSKPIITPLGYHTKLSTCQAPRREEERRKIDAIHYASGVASILYGMVYSKPDLAYVVSVVSRFMENSSKHIGKL